MVGKGNEMQIVTVERGKEVTGDKAERLRFEATIGHRVTDIMERQERGRFRPLDAPDRDSVKRAMEAVERNLVQALWTLARLPGGGSGGGSCGIAYIQDPGDRFSNAVANGGKWEDVAPRPPLPSARSIDAMSEPLDWLTWLPVEQGKLVSTAAATKRGDVERNVSWGRVRAALPQTQSQTIRTLQRRYEDGIRSIVARLTECRVCRI